MKHKASPCPRPRVPPSRRKLARKRARRWGMAGARPTRGRCPCH